VLEAKGLTAADISEIRKALLGLSYRQIRVLQKLGAGEFGMVLQCEVEDKHVQGRVPHVAVKICFNKEDRSTSFHHANNSSEYNMLRELGDHENIVKLLGVILPDELPLEIFELIPEIWQPLCIKKNARDGLCRSKKMLGIVLECHPQTLEELLIAKGPDLIPAEVRKLSIELLSAMEHMQRSGQIHFDLKENNVMVAEDGRLVLVDFGCTQQFPIHNEEVNWVVNIVPEAPPNGNAAQRAPEVVSGIAAALVTPGGKPVDFEHQPAWGAGTMLYYICCGEFPFDDYPLHGTEEHFVRLTPDILAQLDANGGVGFAKVMQGLLCHNLKGRLSLQAALRILNVS